MIRIVRLRDSRKGKGKRMSSPLAAEIRKGLEGMRILKTKQEKNARRTKTSHR